MLDNVNSSYSSLFWLPTIEKECATAGLYESVLCAREVEYDSLSNTPRWCNELMIVSERMYSDAVKIKSNVASLSPKAYRIRRNVLFPECSSGSRKYRNRAGDKLEAVLEESGILNLLRYSTASEKEFVFVDVCGGPGAFSEMLFAWGKENLPNLTRIIGVGITLRPTEQGSVPSSVAWYPSLLAKATPSTSERSSTSVTECFLPLWGNDGTGNLLLSKNVNSFTEECLKNTARLHHSLPQTDSRKFCSKNGVDIVVADGGFDVSGQEALQEVLSAPLLLSEVILALKTLRQGGALVLKAFDTITMFSASLLFILTHCFEHVGLCKPLRSRVVNSERYIVAVSYRKSDLGSVLEDKPNS